MITSPIRRWHLLTFVALLAGIMALGQVRSAYAFSAHISVDRSVVDGDSPAYRIGDPIQVCWHTEIATIANIFDEHAGVVTELRHQVPVTNSLSCLFGTVTGPTGQETFRMDVYLSGVYQGNVRQAITVTSSGPPSGSTTITVDRGPNSTYYVGDPIRICYTVSAPTNVTITDTPSNGITTTILSGHDDGSGDCGDFTVSLPLGQECFRIATGLGQQASVCIHVAGSAASTSISVDRGDGATYYVGDPIHICYTVSGPTYVRVTDTPSSGQATLLVSGHDDGSGDCIDAVVSLPTGQECFRITTSSSQGGAVLAQDQVCIHVASATPISVNIFTDRGEGAHDRVGDPIQLCYTVSQAIYVVVVDIPPTGPTSGVVSRHDDGTGDCLTSHISLPAGHECFRITASNGPGTAVLAQDQTCIWVDAASDTTPPVLNLPGNMSVSALGGGGGTTVTFSASATDAVDGSRPVSCTPSSGSFFLIGTITVNCSASDTSGNVARGSFTVTVRAADDDPPVLTLPTDFTATKWWRTPLAVTWAASAMDFDDGPLPVSCNPASGTGFQIGTYQINCSATDSSGNTARGSFMLTVAAPTLAPTASDPDGDGIPGLPGGPDRCPYHPGPAPDGCPSTPAPPPAPAPAAGSRAPLVPTTQIKIPGGYVGSDGLVHTTTGRLGNVLPIDVGEVKCRDGSTPAWVTLQLIDPIGGGTYTDNPLGYGGDKHWRGDVVVPPNPPGTRYNMRLPAGCPDGTEVQDIGDIRLIDPSGYVTDAVTQKPIAGATVTLQRFLNGTWVDADPNERQSGGSPTMAPAVNPQKTDEAGHYAWDVIPGTWRVTVSAAGYQTQVSRSVAIPPPVTDLNIALVPEGQPQIPFNGRYRAFGVHIARDYP